MTGILFAKKEDKQSLEKLLSDSGLPIEDLPLGLENFFVIKDEDIIIASVGLEISGNYGLLRSLAVAQDYQGKGLANALYLEILELAKKQTISTIFLLTTTADRYFEKLGFIRVSREETPFEIQQSQQFSSICPSTASIMKLEI